MHAERNYLVKVVFPELRERCAGRGLQLVDVDLRWGVTEAESEQGKVVDVILREIEASKPFFVGLLGERYDAVPGDLPPDTLCEHDWLQEFADRSNTELEIIRGVLKSPRVAERSFFYFSDPAFLADIPPAQRTGYEAEDDSARVKLAALKAQVRDSGRPVWDGYPCTWDAANHGHVTGLDEFGQRVLEDIWEAICAEYPVDLPERAPEEVEREQQDAFAEERAQIHIGRLAEKTRLTDWVRGADARPLVVTGLPGSGKSALLAS
jgi:hypothetical protein